MAESLQSLLMQIKPAEILQTLHSHNNNPLKQDEKLYTKQVQRKVDTTYSHAVKVMGQLEEHGLIEFEKKGRKKQIKLTGEGEELAEATADCLETIEEVAGSDE